jgi:signal transduction histidine kinase
MTAVSDWIALASCVGQIALASLLVARGRHSPLVRPLALLCLDFFALTAADLAFQFSSARGWNLLDSAAASLLVPIVLDFFLVFTGRRRALAWLLWTSRVAFGAIAAACVLEFGWTPFGDFAGSRDWARVLLVGATPLLVVILALLVGQLRRAADAAERRLVLAAFAVGAAGNVSDLVVTIGGAVPKLGAAGTLAATILLARAALQLDLLADRRPASMWLGAALVGAAQVGAYLLVFRYFASSTAMLVLASATVTLAAAPIAREILRAHVAERERERHLALLGRLAKEMAHSFLNPLASIKGSAEIVLRDLEQSGGSPETQRRFLDTIVAQSKRLESLVADYQRLAKVEPAFELRDVNEVVASVAEAQAAAAPAGVAVRAELADGPLRCELDSDLVEAALDNLVKNAFDAMRNGGTVTLRTRANGRGVIVAVEDAGAGMEPWVVESAFDEFYTTKTAGSGLGLSYVRRVAEAHGGRATIASRVGAGTTVEIVLRGRG